MKRSRVAAARGPVERLNKSSQLMELQAPHRPIPTRHKLTAPDRVDYKAAEAWVRRRTRQRIRLENYIWEGTPATRKLRERFLKFARVLQAELLHFESWDGTPRS